MCIVVYVVVCAVDCVVDCNVGKNGANATVLSISVRLSSSDIFIGEVEVL